MRFDPHSHQLELVYQPTPDQPYPAELIGPGQWVGFLYHGMTAPNGSVEFRMLKGGRAEKYWMPHPCFDGRPEFKKFEDIAVWQKHGHNAFFGVSLRKKEGVSGDDQVHPTHLIWVDLDMKGTAYIPDGADVLKMSPEALREAATRLYADAMARCVFQELRPVAVVYSGHGLQLYFAREARSTTADTVRINLALFELFQDLGADKTIRNPERILRVPGGFNLKNPERPVQVEVWHIDANARVQDQVVEALIPKPEPRAAAPVSKPPRKVAPVSTDKAKGRAEKRRRAEVAAAVNGEVENVRSALDGERNNTLNIAAVKLARFLPHGELEEGELIEALTTAALAAGLTAGETAATIQSGIAFGTQDPADPQRHDEEEARKEEAKTRPAKVTVERLAPQKASPRKARYTLPTFEKGTQEGTDEANAMILAANNLSDRLRYSMGLGWHVYRGNGTWEKDSELTLAAQVAGEVLREVVGQYFLDAVNQRAGKEELQRIGRWASAVCNVGTVKAALLAAAGKTGFLTSVEAWNEQPDLLNCKNGVLELRTGKLRPHSPDDLMTWQAGAAFNPAAQHPYVDALLELLKADGRYDFIQRSVGSTLYGSAPNEVFTVLQGEGGTGKGTLIDAVVGMLGDYATTVNVEVLLSNNHGETGTGPKPELLKLQGKRLAVAGEPPKGARFNAGRVKGMTGNDPITARTTHSPVMVTFTPVFKLWIHTNYAIGAAHDDTGLQRRIRVVPFTAKPATPDLAFKDTLKRDPTALSALLNWALEGCRLWLSSSYSLGESQAVSTATGGYWKDQNPYDRFAADRLNFAEYVEVTGAALRNAFETWALENGVALGRATKLADLYAYLGRRGTRSEHTRKGNVWVGVELSVNPVNAVNPDPQFFHAYVYVKEETGGEPSQGSQGSQSPLVPGIGEL
ncbi:phage/plasmid primase, P4 family (plasmid) [Deinococcus radiomollis]|uniref:DNA primase family protein n=1 Tax=Deinococcus radiomollis TaxID=468916 RepID=UPI0038929372